MDDQQPNPTRRQRKDTLRQLLAHTDSGKNIESDPRRGAACLASKQTEFVSVFFDERDAIAGLGRDSYFTLTIAGKTYFISEWAVDDPAEQLRVLVELVYRLLFEPAVYNDPYVHYQSKILGNISLDSRGEFVKIGDRGRPRITEMPTIYELIEALRPHGYFPETHKNSEFIQHVRAELPKRD